MGVGSAMRVIGTRDGGLRAGTELASTEGAEALGTTPDRLAPPCALGLGSDVTT